VPIAPGTPAVNPPTPGDPRSLSDTPSSTENFDVVINGVGYMIWRDRDNNPPAHMFSWEGIDYSYSPVFIDRTSVQGDLGDDTQAFYMTFVQRDWSGGEGQKFFRQQDGRDSTYYSGDSIQPTIEPGSVTIGPKLVSAAGMVGTVRGWGSQVYYNADFDNVNLAAGILRLYGTNTSVAGIVPTAEISADLGVTWTTVPKSGAIATTGIYDMLSADDGNVYWLANQNRISKMPASGLFIGGTTVTVTNWTSMSVTALCMSFYQGSMYVGTVDGKFGLTDSTGAFTSIRDFGGGQVVTMTIGAGGLFILYSANNGDVVVYRYDGSAVTELARLPKGWQIGTSGVGVAAVHSMAFLDGVLYVAGSVQAKDGVSAVGAGGVALDAAIVGALWYWAAGNTGIIWRASVGSATSSGRPRNPITIAHGGRIVWHDYGSQKLMMYDPATGGVASIATGSPYVGNWMSYDIGNAGIIGNEYHPVGSVSASNNVIADFQITYPFLDNACASVGWVTSSNFDFNSSLQKYFRTVTIDGNKTRVGDNVGTFDLYYKLDGVSTNTSTYTLIQANATPGTPYNINQTGKSISIMVVLNRGTGTTFTVGPELTRIAVKGVPILPGYRKRLYALALVNRSYLKDGLLTDPATPAAKRKSLESALASNTPVTVSDNTGTMTMVFITDETKIRELSEDEYIAFVAMREV
jgi:hypothetical protein